MDKPPPDIWVRVGTHWAKTANVEQHEPGWILYVPAAKRDELRAALHAENRALLAALRQLAFVADSFGGDLLRDCDQLKNARALLVNYDVVPTTKGE
jgi:hypothetical protein